MKQNTNGELIFSENDLCDLIMQGRNVTQLRGVVVDNSVDLETAVKIVEDPGSLITWTFTRDSDISVPDWDRLQQQNWHMPDQFKQLDIAEYVLRLCKNEQQLQRVGQELLLYQERGLFDLLKYLHYLVTVMQSNNIIWGVGRGSSVASYVLYLLQVHKIDSMFYELDINEFLR